MLKQRKVSRFRMEPTPRQSDELLRMAGTARFVWNWALARCQTFYRQNQKSLPQGQLSNELTELKSQELWLSDFDSQSLQQVLQNLSQAYRNHFNPKMRSGFPKFKTKRDLRQSFRIPQRVVVREEKVYVPKLGWVNLRQSQAIAGETKSATFKRTATGKWYVTLVSEFEVSEGKQTVTRVVGGDLGLETYLTLSDGTENPRFLRQYAKKLRRAQRHLSRKVKGSRNRAKARLRVAKVYERIANLRSNFSHQLTHKLMQYRALCLENLSILGLARTKLAKSMLDAAFGEVVRQWKYKSVWNGTYALQADRFFPSTQICSECGYQNQNLNLSDREWICPTCETKHRRDHNAARNLEDEGRRQLVAMGILETRNACGQCVRPAMVGNAG
jgi:putative transposase